MAVAKANQLYTIGHSNRTIEQFIDLLKIHGIKQVIDIRTIPKSRFNPQFNQDSLEKRLKGAGIGYFRMKNLGGLRQSKTDSVNLGWENLSFRGFADYMQTPEFLEAIEQLRNIAVMKKAVIMCAEAVPWRCHRSLVADALTKHKWKVFHIMSKKNASLHKLTPFLHTKKGIITYPKFSCRQGSSRRS